MVSAAELRFSSPRGCWNRCHGQLFIPRGPVGVNRVYAAVPAGKIEISSWIDSLKHGRTFATNGPLLGFTLGGQQIGGELTLAGPVSTMKFTAWLRSFVPVDHLQVICDGEIVRELPTSI